MGLGACEQMNGIEGFADEIGGSALPRGLHGAFGVVRPGDDDYRKVTYVGKMGTPDPLEQAEAIQFWHGEIGNHKRDGVFSGENLPCALTIDRFDGFKVVTQNFAGGYPDDLGVIDDQ